MAVLERDGDVGVRASSGFALAAVVRVLGRIAGIKPDQSRAVDPIDPRTMAKAFNASLDATRRSARPCWCPTRAWDQWMSRARVLLARLDDPSQIVRLQALQVVCQFSSGVDEAVPVILKAAESTSRRAQTNDVQISFQLRHSAERLRPTSAVVPMLKKGLESQNSRAGRGTLAVLLLGRVGPGVRSAVPALIAATKAMIRSSQGSANHSEEPFFYDLALTLVQVLPADEAVAILREAASPGHYTRPRPMRHRLWANWGPEAIWPCRSCSRRSKTSTSPATGRSGRALRTQLSSRCAKSVRSSLVQGRGRRRNRSPLQVIGLAGTTSFVWRQPSAALGEFGHRASAALPMLRALDENENEPKEVRTAASRAIGKISEEYR